MRDLQINVIDRLARYRLAEGLRQFAAGRWGSEDFEERWVRPAMRSTDAGVREVAWAAWQLYDDFSDVRLVGIYRLSREGRRMIARWVLLLRSGAVYE